MQTIKELILKYGVTASGDTGFSTKGMMLILGVSVIAGIYIYVIYRSFTKSAFYSKDMNITLAGITIVVAAIMVAMQTSLVVSLGMVGALSIVRFRTAIKSPLDLLYLFWAISLGIICGVRVYVLAGLLCAAMTILLYILERLPGAKASILIVIRSKKENSVEAITEVLKKNCKHVKENSCIVKSGERELIFEIDVQKEDVLLQEFENMSGITSVNILRHSGERRL